MEMQSFVMPAWMAGNQLRKDASGDIYVSLDSALHAGMIESRVLLKLTGSFRFLWRVLSMLNVR
jgi:hypothetical protein